MKSLCLLLLIGCASRPAVKADEALLGEPNDIREEHPPKPHETKTICSIQLTAHAIVVDGDEMKQQHVVSHCKARDRAVVSVDQDADLDAWRRLRAALEAAGVGVDVRSQRGREPCEDPLEKGCL